MLLFPLPSSSLLGTEWYVCIFNSRLFGSVDFSVLKEFFLILRICVCWGYWNYKTENDNEIARWWYTILTFFFLFLCLFFFLFLKHLHYLRLPFTHSNIFISSSLTSFCFLFLSLRGSPLLATKNFIKSCFILIFIFYVWNSFAFVHTTQMPLTFLPIALLILCTIYTFYLCHLFDLCFFRNCRHFLENLEFFFLRRLAERRDQSECLVLISSCFAFKQNK